VSQDHEQESPEPQEPQGTLRPITGRALAICAVLGLVGGWALHPLGARATGEPPMVSWAQPLALLLVAAIMAFLAWHTWRTVQQQGHRLETHHAVNRLVLARACALAGSLVAGGYAGFAVSWLGDASERADQWVLRSVLAAVGALMVMLASLALERACRAPGSDGPA
jgi:hypothetical protein